MPKYSNDYEELVNSCYNAKPTYTEIQTGFPKEYKTISTLRDLLDINYKVTSAKEQLYNNLVKNIKELQNPYPKIIGFDDDVVPALNRAILAKHDIFLIGQMGQGKTKIIREIAKKLLSPMPIIQGSMTNDCPMDLPKEDLIALLNDKDVAEEMSDAGNNLKFHISPDSAEKIRDHKLDTPIRWISGESRFKYVLATPDISVKDLVGYIDAIKIAKKGIEMYKIESYSPGKLMQAKHGMICIDELPVLDPRKQVALLSVLQEGMFTTGPYPIIFEPKTVLFATANPMDYTHSSRVIEPLYDRLKSHIHTRYPKTIHDEMLIIIQEAKIPKSSSFISYVLLHALANLVHKIRNSPKINQDRGVSVRFGIHALEILVGEAQRSRGIKYEMLSIPRFVDMYCLTQVAKFELVEIDDNLKNRYQILKELIAQVIKEACLEYVSGIDVKTLDMIKQEFHEKSFHVSQRHTWLNYQGSDKESYYDEQLEDFPILKEVIESHRKSFQEMQNTFRYKITKRIPTQNDSFLKLPTKFEKEELAIITEMILEGLCFTNPKVLDKRHDEGNYFESI